MDDQQFNPTPAQESMPTEPVNNPVVEAPVNEVTNEMPASAPVAPTEPASEPVASAEPVVPTEPVTAPAQPIEAPSMPGFMNQAAPAEPVKKSNTTLILGIILGVLVLAGTGVGIFMLLGNNKTTPTPTTTPAPIPVSNIKTVICKAADGEVWSIEEQVVVDEDEKKVTEIGFNIMADYYATPDTSNYTEPSTQYPGQQAFMAVTLMATALKQAEAIDGVTIVDKTTAEKVDLSYRAVREDITDEATLQQFVESDGKTAAQLKKEIEQSNDPSTGYTLTCTILDEEDE